MPPVTGDEQKLSRFQNEGRRNRLCKERIPCQVRVIDVANQGEIRLFGIRIEERLLVRGVHYKLFSPVHLHEKRMHPRSIIVQHRKCAALAPDKEFYGSSTIENSSDVTN